MTRPPRFTATRSSLPTFTTLALATLALTSVAWGQATRVGPEFVVNAYTTSFQRYSSVAADADGDFVVVWNSNGQDGGGTGVFGRRFSSTGAPLASEFQVATYTEGNQTFASVATDADGDFVIAWQSNGQDGSGYGVFARSFSSAGVPRATELQVNTFTASQERWPSVAAADIDGRFVVAWHGYGQDGESYGILAQRFGPPITLDVDGDGSVAPLTDGLLVLRYLFGFTGSTLSSGAVGGSCTRCDAATEIEPYLAGIS